jgi:hypothetical protein
VSFFFVTSLQTGQRSLKTDYETQNLNPNMITASILRSRFIVLNTPQLCCGVRRRRLTYRRKNQTLGNRDKMDYAYPSHCSRSSKATQLQLKYDSWQRSKIRFFAAGLNYGGLLQRAVVVWSEEMKKRNEKTFERKSYVSSSIQSILPVLDSKIA